MLKAIDRHNPSFGLFPVNNNRTAWRPFGLPAILIVPHAKSYSGNNIYSGNVFNVRIYVEDVPREALIAGHNNISKRYPDRELYSESISSFELSSRLINPSSYQFYNASGDQIDGPVEGEYFEYITSTGIVDKIQFFGDADYYDLSDIKIEVELLPEALYNLVYEAEYFTRVVSQDELQEFLCINENQVAKSRFKFQINHPGHIISEFYNLTPPPYFTDANKASDMTIAEYRPFTDMLQDIYDEQSILERINWVFSTPPEAIPYVSSLLGWDIPYFPESLDQLRRAVLRRTVEFQNLAGSRRALVNLFRLFGFEILITNLWWSADGKRFIRPGEKLPTEYKNQEIQVKNRYQVDLALNDFDKIGFNELKIPLLYRPQIKSSFDDFVSVRDGGDVTVESYLVAKGSEAHTKLTAISQELLSDPSGFGEKYGCYLDNNGYINSNFITNSLVGVYTGGFSQILIGGKLGEPSQQLIVGKAPVTDKNLSLDRETNSLNLTINGHIDSTSYSIFTFALYERQEVVVPNIIADLQSNRFDIQVLTQNFEDYADPVTLEFATEFLYRLKAFHSLLNIIRTRAEFTETYEVTDWCVGGDIQMRYDIDAGMLQVPPAVIPNIPGTINDCSLLDPKNLGYKDSDILLRLRKLANLPEEHAAWKILDSRSDTPQNGLYIGPTPQAPGRETCKYTYRGQDRIQGIRVDVRGIESSPKPNSAQQIAGIAENPKASPNDIMDNGVFQTTGASVTSNSNSGAYGSFNIEYTEIRQPSCDETRTEDFCYKGRVDDELLFRNSIVTTDHIRCKPCQIGMGSGMYYLYPAYSQVNIPGVSDPSVGSLTLKTEFTGLAKSGNQQYFTTGIQGNYLTADYNKPLNDTNNSRLGQLYRSYGTPENQTLHYHNRNSPPNPDQRFNLALDKPSLVIEKPTLHIPGCRFPTLNRLGEDYVHPIWKARPWDDAYNSLCGSRSICGDAQDGLLSSVLVLDSNGDETLSFAIEDYIIFGNGLTPDIPSLGSHSLGTESSFNESEVIHEIYMEDADSPYVTLDQVCDYEHIGYLSITDPLFNSHNQCTSGETFDFADGYPCVAGIRPYDGEDYSDWIEVLEELGMPVNSDTGQDVLFLLNSGIRDVEQVNLRLDCGCLLAGCDDLTGTDLTSLTSTDPSDGLTRETICSSDLFKDQDGQYDWNCDHLRLDINLKLVETVGMCSTRLDGSIPTLLELV